MTRSNFEKEKTKKTFLKSMQNNSLHNVRCNYLKNTPQDRGFKSPPSQTVNQSVIFDARWVGRHSQSQGLNLYSITNSQHQPKSKNIWVDNIKQIVVLKQESRIIIFQSILGACDDNGLQNILFRCLKHNLKYNTLLFQSLSVLLINSFIKTPSFQKLSLIAMNVSQE